MTEEDLLNHLVFDNDYLLVILVTYFMNTRKVGVVKAIESLKDKNFRLQICKEYIQYSAGFDVEFQIDDKEPESQFQIPTNVTTRCTTMYFLNDLKMRAALDE
jgi:hypothetical protein